VYGALSRGAAVCVWSLFRGFRFGVSFAAATVDAGVLVAPILGADVTWPL